MLGMVQLEANEREIIAWIEKAKSANPDALAPRLWVGLSYLRTKNFDKASEELTEAQRLHPKNPDVLAALAGLEVQAGRNAEALKLARQLQLLAPESPAGLIIEGDVFTVQKQYGDALKAYEKAFAIRQTSLLAIKLHAAQSKAGNTEEADSKLQRWLKDRPDNVAVRQYLAGESLNSGRNKLAIEQYQFLLKKDPNNVLALNNLAHLYQLEKDPRALDTAEQAYRLQPEFLGDRRYPGLDSG